MSIRMEITAGETVLVAFLFQTAKFTRNLSLIDLHLHRAPLPGGFSVVQFSLMFHIDSTITERELPHIGLTWICLPATSSFRGSQSGMISMYFSRNACSLS